MHLKEVSANDVMKFHMYLQPALQDLNWTHTQWYVPAREVVVFCKQGNWYLFILYAGM
jgi:hypothetical protein